LVNEVVLRLKISTMAANSNAEGISIRSRGISFVSRAFHKVK